MSPGYVALRQAAAWLDLSARARLVVRGRDRARYLHNVASNDVKNLTLGSSCYAFLLTPQGRIQADLELFCFADHFLIDTEPDLREKVPPLILKYKVGDQVELEDATSQTAAVGVEGPNADQIRPAVSVPGFTVLDASLTGQPGFRVSCSSDQFSELVRLVEAAGAAAATAEDARTVSIENGKHRYGEDIVERIRSLGHVNRLLVRLEVETAVPLAAGTKLNADGQQAGEITSSVFSPQSGRLAALGYVRPAYAATGTALEAGGFRARVG